MTEKFKAIFLINIATVDALAAIDFVTRAVGIVTKAFSLQLTANS